MILPDIHNPFFADIVAGVNTALDRTQYQVFFGIGLSSAATEQALIDAMMDRQMDGIILIGPRLTRQAIDAVARRIPLAIIAHAAPAEASRRPGARRHFRLALAASAAAFSSLSACSRSSLALAAWPFMSYSFAFCAAVTRW